MANLGNTFDATQVQPQGNYELIPAGTYRAAIVASEMKATKAGTGQFLLLELQIIEGQFQGRKLFDRLNLINPNPDAVSIAQRQLSAICHATGKLQVTDSSQLHDIPINIKVKIQPGRDNYEDSNAVNYIPKQEEKYTPPRSEPTKTKSTPW